MIQNLLRGFGLILFVLIMIMDDFPFYEKMKQPYIQLVFAVIITCLCVYDYILGFIYAMVLMLIYYEIYSKKKQIDIKNDIIKDKYNTNMKHQLFENFMEKYQVDDKIYVNFISEQHLDAAQSGYIFDQENYNNNNTLSQNIDYDVQGLTNTVDNNIVGLDMLNIKENVNIN